MDIQKSRDKERKGYGTPVKAYKRHWDGLGKSESRDSS